MLRLSEDDSADAQGSTLRGEQSGLDIYAGLRRPQSGTHANPSRRSSGGESWGPTGVSRSIELEPEATKAPENELFDIINDDQQKEKHAANQFFSSLLVFSYGVM